MPKQSADSRLNPANLWGKPLPVSSRKAEPAAKRTPAAEQDFTEEDDVVDGSESETEIDVDAELSEDEPDDGDLAEVESTIDEPDDEDEDEDAESADEPESDEDEDYEHDYAPEAGDSAVTRNQPSQETSEEVVANVEYDNEDDVTPHTRHKDIVRQPRGESSMATAEKKMSLSDHVRKEIDRRKTAGASLRGVDIVGALEKRGITVSAAQVSQLLKKAGLGGARRGTEKPQPTEAAGETASRIAHRRKTATTGKAVPNNGEKIRIAPKSVPAASGRGFHVPLEQLKAAEVFVTACGGFKSAERILTAAATLSQTFNG